MTTGWAAACRQAILNASVESAVGRPVPSSARVWVGRDGQCGRRSNGCVSTHLRQSAAHASHLGLTENNGLTFTANSLVTSDEISESVKTFLTLWVTFLTSRGFWGASAKVKEGPKKVGPVQDPSSRLSGVHILCVTMNSSDLPGSAPHVEDTAWCHSPCTSRSPALQSCHLRTLALLTFHF